MFLSYVLFLLFAFSTVFVGFVHLVLGYWVWGLVFSFVFRVRGMGVVLFIWSYGYWLGRCVVSLVLRVLVRASRMVFWHDGAG